MKSHNTVLAILLAYALAVPPGVGGQLTNIGAAGAVSGRVTAQATVQRSKIRVISSGKVLYYRDDIATNAKGRMQILLLDETVFTVGPDTELTLDEFVYDPFTETGKVTASLTKGAIKFVSGRIAAKTPKNMKIVTPVGTIGVRGTAGSAWTDGKSVMVGNRGPGPNNNAKAKPGAVTLTGTDSKTGKRVSVEVRRVGSIAEIKSKGAAPIVRNGTPADWAKLTPTQKAKGSSKDDGPGGKAKASK
ncbi:MAG: FecR family protein, partial [Elusimicrobiota bacterium]